MPNLTVAPAATITLPTATGDIVPVVACHIDGQLVDAEFASARCDLCGKHTCLAHLDDCQSHDAGCRIIDNGLCEACRDLGVADCTEWAA